MTEDFHSRQITGQSRSTTTRSRNQIRRKIRIDRGVTMNGYMGKMLHINLSTKRIEHRETDGELLDEFIGGRGLGAKLLYDLLKPDTHPLSEDNILVILTGPLTGTLAPVGSKYVVVTKSPATGLFLDTYASGRIAPEIKFAGYDGIVIRGKAETPSYVLIENEKIEIRNASKLWGKDTFEAEESLHREIGKDLGVMVIGPAGERLVKIAGINSDFYRQAARGGGGAVMGSKNLKAVAVRGTGGVKVAYLEKILKLVRKHQGKVRLSSVAQARKKYGTPMTLDITSSAGMLPTRNFQTGIFPKARGMLDGAGVRKYAIADRGCYGCIISCGKITQVKTGPFSGRIVEGPEYETIGMMGANLGINYLPAVIEANLLCDKLGLDTISAGAVIGFVMECYEKNLVAQNEVNGLDLHFGNYEAVLQLIKDIAYRRGIGDLLAEGVKRASEAIGGGSEKFAMHVKGLEFPAYDPRAAFGAGLAYAVSPRGACHRRAWPPAQEVLGSYPPYTAEGKAALVKRLYDENTIFHSALVCDFPGKFIPLAVDDYAEYLALATGRTFTSYSLWEASDRIETQIRLCNVREGSSRRDDTLPYRILYEPMPEGPPKGQCIGKEGLEKMLNEYYELRGWDEMGIPKETTLRRYGLS